MYPIRCTLLTRVLCHIASCSLAHAHSRGLQFSTLGARPSGLRSQLHVLKSTDRKYDEYFTLTGLLALKVAKREDPWMIQMLLT